MKPSALLLLLDALLGLVERQLQLDSGDPASDFRLVSEQVQRLVAVHVRLADTAIGSGGWREEPETITAATVHAILRTRKLRSRHFGPEIADAGWTLLLTLYAARLEQRRFSATRLGEEAALPPTTSLRWMHALHDKGLCTWQDDPEDERIARIGLSDEAAARVEAYLKAALRISPVVL